MRNLFIFFLSSLLCHSAFTWDITDKNKAEEYGRWLETVKAKINMESEVEKKRRDEIQEKYWKNNIEIEEKDIRALAEFVRFTGDMQYLQIGNSVIKLKDAISGLPSNAPPVIRKILIYQNDINNETLKKLREKFYEIATKIERKEIKIGMKDNIDVMLSIHITELENNTSEVRAMLEEVRKGKMPNFAKSNNKRDLAKNDVIAQALNYSVGVPEDAQGPNYFYPIDTKDGKCVYGMTSDDSQMGQFSQSMQGAIGSMMPLLGATGVQLPNTSTTFDLSKVDFSTTAYYKKNGVTPRTKYSAGTPYLKYQVKVDGLPDLFECDSSVCNIERLQRAWNLIAKTCVGIKKPF